MQTIRDRLSEVGISWSWYADGWNDALQGRADPSFSFIFSSLYTLKIPLVIQKQRKKYLKDEAGFYPGY
jgi:phospholipase C